MAKKKRITPPECCPQRRGDQFGENIWPRELVIQLDTLQGIKIEVRNSHRVILPLDLLSGSTK